VTNPLLDFTGTPRFGEVSAEHVGPAITALIAEAEAAVARVETGEGKDWDSVIVPIEEALERLGRAWGLVGHLQAVVSTPELRAAHAENLDAVSRFYSSISQNPGIYRRYAALNAAPSLGGDEAVRRHILAHALRDFRLSGADLDADTQAQVMEVQAELSALSTRFSNNLLDATDGWSLHIDDAARLAGIPQDSVAAFRAAAEAEGKSGWKLTLQAPCYIAVTTYADDRSLRETLHRAYATRASDLGDPAHDNGAVMTRILALRARLASLLGQESYAGYALATKMADTPAQVLAFLREIAARSRPAALRDVAALRDFAAGTLGIDPLEPWDNAYVGEKLKQARFAFSSQTLKSYFTQERVLAGAFALVERLYEIRFMPDAAPGWHEDVRCYALTDAGGGTIGQLYLDLYAREGKRGGAWMDSSRERRRTAQLDQRPVAYIVCNFGRGTAGRPATFTHDDVITLFHELGHALHALLTDQGELAVSGISGVEWDAVELPSQFMENFCWEWDILQTLTAQVDTGEPLPRDLFDRMLAARSFQAGLAATRQVEFGVFDMSLHEGAADGTTPLDLWTRVREEVSVLPVTGWNRFPNSFSHIFSGGYAAGYYGYMWAEVMSADAYGAFTDAPAAFAETAARFRAEILGRGGSRPAADNFVAFRGRAPDPEALLVSRGIVAR
jgi:oligopeptidase A